MVSFAAAPVSRGTKTRQPRLHQLVPVRLFAAAPVLVLSCNDATGPGDENEGDPETFTYPHPDGAEWVYTGFGDDTKVMLNGTSTHSTAGTVQNLEWWSFDTETEQWEYKNTSYLHVSNGEVRYFNYLDDPSNELWLKYPLEVGDSWTIRGSKGNSAEVIRREDITVPAGTFPDCYAIKMDFTVPNITYWVWYASGSGGRYGVKIRYESFDEDELLSYNIPSK